MSFMRCAIYKTALLLLIGWSVLGSVWGDGAFDWPVAPNLKESLPLIGVDQVHALGITGRGVRVLVIDNFTPNPLDPCNAFVHGDWVAGVLKAVAPGAELLTLDVPLDVPTDHCYAFSTSSLENALRSAREYHHQFGIDVINYSI